FGNLRYSRLGSLRYVRTRRHGETCDAGCSSAMRAMTDGTKTKACSRSRRAAWSSALAGAWMCIAFALPTGAAPLRNVLLVIADDYGFDSQSLYNTNSAA